MDFVVFPDNVLVCQYNALENDSVNEIQNRNKSKIYINEWLCGYAPINVLQVGIIWAIQPDSQGLLKAKFRLGTRLRAWKRMLALSGTAWHVLTQNSYRFIHDTQFFTKYRNENIPLSGDYWKNYERCK